MNIHSPSAQSPSRILVKILQGRNAPVDDLGTHVAAAIAVLLPMIESASIVYNI